MFYLCAVILKLSSVSVLLTFTPLLHTPLHKHSRVPACSLQPLLPSPATQRCDFEVISYKDSSAPLGGPPAPCRQVGFSAN